MTSKELSTIMSAFMSVVFYAPKTACWHPVIRADVVPESTTTEF
jgi:hypothetical protein